MTPHPVHRIPFIAILAVFPCFPSVMVPLTVRINLMKFPAFLIATLH